ncbi:hypothetical protein RclHR1_08250004 [Rhizophagus clarus]|uniref:F-box domain-containing protein n=1 Tax=Rhizophagus clarus TaxID=94130 RepID=A0A2Z6SMS3_9GLOM|nr:hypothetical protein RclHR1_08250004 [Rhizophagus clarus]GES92504.1 hypothetical protein GLOIN_2v1512321 [Rhizophagus clarus]
MNQLSTEVLEQVFRKLREEYHTSRYEFSASLVNRRWCRIIIPIMWEDPFGSTNFPDRLVKIFLSILDDESRLLLNNNEVDLSKSPSFQATFDYAYFIRSLQLDRMYDGIRNYLFADDIGYNQLYKGEEQIKKYKKIGCIFRVISSLILRRSGRIEHIRPIYPYGLDYAALEDDINLIPYLTNANKCLKYLRVVMTFGGDYTKFYLGLLTICKNLITIITSITTLESANALATLIRAQNSLEDLSVFFTEEYFLESVLESLSSQKESLISLTLNTCSFNTISDDALKSFVSCKKLERLVLERCIGLEKERFISLSRSFPMLKEVIFYYKHYIGYFPDNFIVGLIETANVNLRKLDFNFYSSIVVNAILNYIPEFDLCRFGFDYEFKSYKELKESEFHRFIDGSGDYSNVEEESSEAEDD